MTRTDLRPNIDDLENAEAFCNNCGLAFAAENALPIKDIEQRLDPGSTVPAGECPHCGALAYIQTPWTRLEDAAPDMLAALEGVVRVADRKTDEFDAARAAIRKAKGE